MIEAEGLTKRYGQTVALGGIDLQVPAGSILGMLGLVRRCAVSGAWWRQMA